jgi:uncharacterized membrane protein
MELFMGLNFLFFFMIIGVTLYLLVGRSMKRIRDDRENYSSQKYDHLAKIKKLLDDGVISQEEFESEKNKILK